LEEIERRAELRAERLQIAELAHRPLRGEAEAVDQAGEGGVAMQGRGSLASRAGAFQPAARGSGEPVQPLRNRRSEDHRGERRQGFAMGEAAHPPRPGIGLGGWGSTWRCMLPLRAQGSPRGKPRAGGVRMRPQAREFIE
jgi:hypothetical protein